MIVQVIWEHTDLFDMQEVFSFKRNPVPWNGDVVIICRSVGEVCAHRESNRLKLNNRNKKERVKPLYFDNTTHRMWHFCIRILCEHMNCNSMCIFVYLSMRLCMSEWQQTDTLKSVREQNNCWFKQGHMCCIAPGKLLIIAFIHLPSNQLQCTNSFSNSSILAQ